MIAGLDCATVPFWGFGGEDVGVIEVGLHVARREDGGTGTGDGVGKRDCGHSIITACTAVWKITFQVKVLHNQHTCGFALSVLLFYYTIC